MASSRNADGGYLQCVSTSKFPRPRRELMFSTLMLATPIPSHLTSLPPTFQHGHLPVRSSPALPSDLDHDPINPMSSERTHSLLNAHDTAAIIWVSYRVPSVEAVHILRKLGMQGDGNLGITCWLGSEFFRRGARISLGELTKNQQAWNTSS